MDFWNLVEMLQNKVTVTVGDHEEVIW